MLATSSTVRIRLIISLMTILCGLHCSYCMYQISIDLFVANYVCNFLLLLYVSFFIPGSPTDRKISFAVFGQTDKSDSVHSSATSLSLKEDDLRSSKFYFRENIRSIILCKWEIFFLLSNSLRLMSIFLQSGQYS